MRNRHHRLLLRLLGVRHVLPVVVSVLVVIGMTTHAPPGCHGYSHVSSSSLPFSSSSSGYSHLFTPIVTTKAKIAAAAAQRRIHQNNNHHPQRLPSSSRMILQSNKSHSISNADDHSNTHSAALAAYAFDTNTLRLLRARTLSLALALTLTMMIPVGTTPTARAAASSFSVSPSITSSSSSPSLLLSDASVSSSSYAVQDVVSELKQAARTAAQAAESSTAAAVEEEEEEDEETAVVQAAAAAEASRDATLQAYTRVATLITDDPDSSSIVDGTRGYVADEDTRSRYNPGLAVLSENEKRQLVQALIETRRTAISAATATTTTSSLTTTLWNDDLQVAYTYLKDLLDPWHMTELRPYWNVFPAVVALTYSAVLLVQQQILLGGGSSSSGGGSSSSASSSLASSSLSAFEIAYGTGVVVSLVLPIGILLALGPQ